jgi:hypothetical protein
MALISPDFKFGNNPVTVDQLMFAQAEDYVDYGRCRGPSSAGRAPIPYSVSDALTWFGVGSNAPSLVDMCQRLEDAGLVARREDPPLVALAVEESPAQPAETEVVRPPLA